MYPSKNWVHCLGNKRRGTNYELKAFKELVAHGYGVVKSGGSLGAFDLWAAGEGKLRLIQVKATKQKGRMSYSKDRKVMLAVDDRVKLPRHTKEIWVWRHRKGWEKVIVK